MLLVMNIKMRRVEKRDKKRVESISYSNGLVIYNGEPPIYRGQH